MTMFPLLKEVRTGMLLALLVCPEEKRVKAWLEERKSWLPSYRIISSFFDPKTRSRTSAAHNTFAFTESV